MTGPDKPFDSKLLSKRLDVNFALQAAGLGVWEIDPETNQVLWDDQCRALVGLDTDNHLPFEQAIQYIHPDDLARVLAAIQWAMKPESGGIFDETYRTLGADGGKLRWVRFWGQSYFTPDSKLYRFSGVAQEVTQQVKAQQALAESEAHLELLRNTVPAMIMYLDTAQRYQSYNGVFREWFGVEGDEAIGKTVREFLSEKAYATTSPHLAKAYAGQQERYEMYAPSRMHVDRWLSIVYTPHKNAEDKVIGVIVHATDITQNKLAELELRNSEARFRSLIEEAPVATCLFVGPTMTIAVANEIMIGFWGKDSSVLGKPILEAVPELKDQPFPSILDEVFRTGVTYQAQGMAAQLEVNGVLDTYYYDFTYKPLRNAAGEVYGIMDMAVDVTEEVKAHQKLQEAQESLRGAMELADIGTWELDLNLGLITYSEVLKQLFEFTEDSLASGSMYNTIDEPDWTRIQAALDWASTPELGGLLDEEYTIVTKQTRRHRRVRAQARMFFDANQQPYKMVGTMRDVTEERQLQLALEQLVQQRTEELAAANQELAAINEVLAITSEETNATNDELTEANQNLIRSNKNLEQFAYIASHDLQEPLRKIQSFGDLLKSRYSDQLADGVDYVDRMQSAASRMSTLVRDLLTFSRISTRQDTSAWIYLPELIQGILSDLDLRIKETGAVVQIESLPTVYGDPMQLGQLFQNLLSNALKFHRTDSAPHIRVSAQVLNARELPASVKPARNVMAYHCIEVADNGIGFDEKYLDRIFQVFQRLHGKNEFVGTGIGLAICEKVVTNHGGAITASSQPGQGAVFSIYLPV